MEPARPPPAAAAAATSSVLGDGDLLREILLRLDSPDCLVRAAAVSKRWLRHASDPAVLRRFRRLHPPRLLGFYVRTAAAPLRFVPMPQPPELAAVIRRAQFDVGGGGAEGRVLVSDCRNGRLIALVGREQVMWSPLHPGKGTTNLPSPPICLVVGDNLSSCSEALLFQDGGGGGGGDAVGCAAVTVMHNERQAQVQFSVLQDGAWGEARNSDLIQLPGPWITSQKPFLLAPGKLYMICMATHILGLDLPSMSSFCIKLPDGAEYEYDTSLALSRAEGYGFCLIHVRKFQISIWRYSTDSSTTGNWKVIDTISLDQAFGQHGIHGSLPGWLVRVVAVGDNADFVFLKIFSKVFYVHIPSRKVEKVYEPSQRDDFLVGLVHPFMMVWPPTFPALNGGHDQDG
ncbi:hypothetical protein ACP4OV_019148 [Aristida adscensionis]